MGVQFLHILTDTWYGQCYLDFSPSVSGCEWYLIMALICFFLMTNESLSTFHVFIDYLEILFCEEPIPFSFLFL